MNPQRPHSYAYPEDEFSRIDMTLAEARAIREGHDDRWDAWKDWAKEAAKEAQEIQDEAGRQSDKRAKEFAEAMRHRPRVADALFQ